MARLCFASFEIYPITPGGCGVFLHHALNRLLPAGHDVRLLLDVPRDDFVRFVDTEIPRYQAAGRLAAYRVDDLCDDFPHPRERTPDPYLRNSLRFAHALRRLPEPEPFDLVEFFDYCGAAYSTLIAKLTGTLPQRTTIAVRAHGTMELIESAVHADDGETRLRNGLEQAALALAETVFFPSREVHADQYRDHYDLPESAIVVSPPPVERFPPQQVDRTARREVVCYGRLAANKGTETFVRAALQVLETPGTGVTPRFVLIGPDGPGPMRGQSYRQHLEALVPSRHRISFELTGPLAHAQVIARLREARFAVFPSIFETFSYAVHEVAGTGVPIVVCDLPAHRSWARHDETALVFDGSVDALALQMRRLLADETLLVRLAHVPSRTDDGFEGYYLHPHPLRPLTSPPTTLAVLVVVAVGGSPDRHVRDTIDSLRLEPRDRLLLHLADGSFVAADATSPPLEPPLTLDALWVLAAGDRPLPRFLDRARSVLQRNTRVDYVGSWLRSGTGVLVRGPRLEAVNGPVVTGPPRALIRTPAGEPLAGHLSPAIDHDADNGIAGCGVVFAEAEIHVPETSWRPSSLVSSPQTHPKRRHWWRRFVSG